MLLVQRFKDIHVARFDSDDDVALFVSGTSDVLLCSASVWEAVHEARDGGQASVVTGSNQEPEATSPVPESTTPDPESTSPAEVLKSTLIKLGAKFH